jgi:1,4-dihydroxy-2-naphthoate polyprenyltransferase
MLNLEKIKLIIELGRLHFLLAGFLLYLLGVLLAVILYHQFSWEKFLWGYAVFLPAHLMVNYSNEYFDQEVDKFSSKTNFSGGSGVLLSHPELSSFAKGFSLTMILVSLILGISFSYFYNSPLFLVLTLSGNLLGWFYSAPPLKLSYRGFGEVATMITGFLMPSLGFVAITGSINSPFILFSLPIMLFLLLFILSVEIPDREADLKGGKNTFIVRYGRVKSLILTVVASALASLSFLSLPNNLYPPINLNLIALLSLIPLLSAFIAYLNRKTSLVTLSKYVNRNVTTLIVFVTLVNAYFLTLIYQTGL